MSIFLSGFTSVAALATETIDLAQTQPSLLVDFAVPVLIDHSGELSIDQVRAPSATFVAARLDDLTSSKWPATVWLRLDLNVANSNSNAWHLLLEGSGFSSAQAYFVAAPESAARKIAGNRLPTTSNSAQQRVIFELPMTQAGVATRAADAIHAFVKIEAAAQPAVRLIIWDDGEHIASSAYHGVGEPAFGVLTVMSVMTLLVGLFWRDRRLLLLFALSASGLLTLLIADGFVWQIQHLSRLGTSSFPLVFFAGLTLLFALRYTREAMHLIPARQPLAKVISVAEWSLAVLVVASAFVPRTFEPMFLQAMTTLGYTGAALAILAGLVEWRAQRQLNALLVVVAFTWLVLAVGAALFAQTDTFWHNHGLHIAVAGAILLLATSYVNQIMQVRNRYELQIARSGVDATLWRVERSRRNFAGEVNELIEALDPDLYEEAIMARFLEYLTNMIPVAAA
ncbi:MAG: hypothetical protein HKO07_08930, partial [Pseudomonadales bacterium]|nr:hypothetical protein [Pseudomonadales bacterium]